MGFKSAIKSFNKVNPYAKKRKRRDSLELPLKDEVVTDEGKASTEKAPVTSQAQNEILAGNVAPVMSSEIEREIGAPPPDLYSRTRALGQAPTFDNKNTNSALSSGLKKGWDAFLRSGNPFAFGFGLASGATVDKAYDERKSFREKRDRYDENYKRAYTQDKAEADTYFKQADVNESNRKYRLDAEKFKVETANKEEDNKRANRVLAHQMVVRASKSTGQMLPGEREFAEQHLGKLPPTITPETANRLLQMQTPDGNVYGVVDINSDKPARVIPGPDGNPVKIKKSDPLIQQFLGEDIKDEGKLAELEVQPTPPSQLDAIAKQRALAELRRILGANIPEGILTSEIGRKEYEKQLKIVTEEDKNRVETERGKKGINARRESRKKLTTGASPKIPASEAAKKYNFQ